MKYLFPGAIIYHPRLDKFCEIISASQYRYLDESDRIQTLPGEHYLLTWDYRKSGWVLSEESIIDKVLEKYNNL
jgi:hypothetical protein